MAKNDLVGAAEDQPPASVPRTPETELPSGRDRESARTERRLTDLIENFDMAAVSVDLEGRITFCNRYFGALTGWESELVLGSRWLELFVPPEDVEAGERFLGQVREGSLHAHADSSILTRSGDRRLISWTHTLERDASGAVIGVTSVGRDVTEQSQAGERLREAEAKYRTLVEQIPAVAYIDALDGCVTSYVGPQYEGLFGYTQEERITDPELWPKLLHPDDREQALAASDRSDKTGEPFKMEYRMIARDGRVVWVHDEAYLVMDDEGQPICWQGVLFDITERMEAEEHRREAEAKYRTLVEQIPAVTYIQPPDDGLTFVPLYISPQVETMTGHTPEEWMTDGDLWSSLLHPADRGRALALNERSTATGEPFKIEYRMIARDGRVVWVHEEAELVHDELGAPLFWHGVMFDITELKRSEEELKGALQIERQAAERLRQADRMKSAFLTAVSHELRTPLTGILGGATTLEKAGERMSPEERLSLVSGLASSARRLAELMSDILDVDRLARGVVEPKSRPTDVGALVRRVVVDSGLLGERAVHVEARPVVACVDAPMVERIVENLLANAVRHTPPGTAVCVRVSKEQDGALIAVEDEGPGVPEELRETLFEPFRQGLGVSTHSPGLGLGLSLVAKFAELHRGRAWVQERSGGGASFRVLLPTGDVPEAAAAHDADDVESGRP